MRKLTSLVYVAVALLVGCGGKEERSSSAATVGGATATGGATSIHPTAAGSTSTGGTSTLSTAQAIDANTVITLERSTCFGLCPAYKLRITGDGTVTYEGLDYVKVVGNATEQISIVDVQWLVDEFVQANYFALAVPDPCPEGTETDSPTYTTSLTYDGRTHTVVHYDGNLCAPAVLSTLEDRIDEVTYSVQWVKCDTASGYCFN